MIQQFALEAKDHSRRDRDGIAEVGRAKNRTKSGVRFKVHGVLGTEVEFRVRENTLPPLCDLRSCKPVCGSQESTLP